MTRWARAKQAHRHKVADATPWSQLRRVGAGGPRRKVQRLSRGEDHMNKDVNGFLELLRQSGGGGSEGGGERCGGQQALRQEVQEALKKDGRREWRRLKRQQNKKDHMLCFLCRRPGHGLTDCPDADRDRELARGVCYRCGSTEHEASTCRVKLDPAVGDFPYAKCFTCGQTGHLSRSCPENPRGLYASGGSCRVCGSVEHFQRDCPERQSSAHSVTLGWLSNNMSADHEDVLVPFEKKGEGQRSTKVKVVKF